MSRTAAKFNQADLARTIRAAKQAGGEGVELRPDGTIYIHLSPSFAQESTTERIEEDEGEAF